MRMHRILIGCAFGILTLIPSQVMAQSDTKQLTELVGEVRLLRQAVETLAGASIRVQIVFGRLQLQEQRVSASLQRLDTIRQSLAGLSSNITEFSASLQQFEDADAAGKDPKQREEIAEMIRGTKLQIAKLEIERTRVTAEEAEAANRLAQEQGQWSDLNRSLEEIERALAPKRQ